MSMVAARSAARMAWSGLRKYWWLLALFVLLIIMMMFKPDAKPKSRRKDQDNIYEGFTPAQVEIIEKVQDKIDVATVDIRVEREKSRVKTEVQRKELEEIKSEKEPKVKRERLSSWLSQNL